MTRVNDVGRRDQRGEYDGFRKVPQALKFLHYHLPYVWLDLLCRGLLLGDNTR